MRAIGLCALCVFSMASLPLPARAEGRDTLLAGGISLEGNTFRGLDLSGAGPYAALELGLAEDFALEVDYRRHSLSDPLEDPASVNPTRARSEMVSVLLRHSLLMVNGEHYLDLQAGLGSQRFDPDGEPAKTRRNLRVGVTFRQPGSMYHLTGRLELRFGIDVLFARAWPTPGPADCTGPCTSATAGRSHDFGFLGTFAIGVR